MNEWRVSPMRLYVTMFATLVELVHLGLEFVREGVRSHHVLHRADLPAISNWWGVVLIPALAWFLSGRLERRGVTLQSMPRAVVLAFLSAALAGALLSAAFIAGYESAASNIFLGIAIAAVLFPVYRAECLLGFVLAMTFTFGAVLPTVAGTIIAAFSAAIHLLLWRPLMKILRRRSS